MCQQTTTPEIKIADRDIKCYKRLKFDEGKAFATNWYYEYTPKNVNPEIKIKAFAAGRTDKGASFMVHDGYHSYINGEGNKEYTNAIFIIPKGATYIVGFDNGWTIPSRVSSTIIYVGKRWSIRTFFRLRKYKTK